jgi:hypothetical protein
MRRASRAQMIGRASGIPVGIVAIVIAVTCGCGPNYALGPLLERTEVYYLNDSTDPPVCTAVPLAASTMFYDVTPADPDMFATLTQVTE